MDNGALRKKAEELVREAGKIILSYRFKLINSREKKDGGLVTDADIAAEDFLIKELANIEPSITFFTEENGESSMTSDYCWVIDPLDGTTNFAYGLPHFCVSVALTYKKKPILGFVYQPILNQMFYAELEKGAFMNGRPLKVSQTKNMSEAIVAFCNPCKDRGGHQLFERIVQLSQAVYSMRILGAAALDQSYVAAGFIDGVFFEQLSWWDFAAGSLIIEEAGGVVSDYQNNQVQMGSGSLVAGNPWIHEKLVEELSEG